MGMTKAKSDVLAENPSFFATQAHFFNSSVYLIQTAFLGFFIGNMAFLLSNPNNIEMDSFLIATKPNC